MVRITLNNYLLPYQLNSIIAKAYYHSIWIVVVRVSHTEICEYSDNHYCLVLIKCIKQFASMFADMSVIISQNDKAKIELEVLAIGCIFHILQSINKPMTIADHDFPMGFRQKLILLVYLIINPNKSNDELRIRKLAIFIRSQ